MRKQLNLVGQKFGRYTVIELDITKAKDGHCKWICKCDCGNIKSVTTSNLTRRLGSCGCLKAELASKRTRKNLLGQTFGRLTVIESLPKNNGNRTQWLCQCECGNFTNVITKNLTEQKTQSCGCYKKERTIECHWKGYQEISGKFFHQIQRGASCRGLEFNITIEQIWDLLIKQDKKCAISGIDLIVSRHSYNCKKRERSERYIEGNASLDRIDSSKGYTIDNVQWVDKYINMAKQNLSDEEFIELCRRVVNYQDSKNGVNKDVSTN